MNALRCVLSVYFAIAATIVSAQACPSGLDGGFGTGGIVYDPNALGYLNGMSVYPNGDILVAANAYPDAALLLYDSEGRRRESFGDQGIAELHLDRADGSFRAVAVQPDGRIVAGGQAIHFDGPSSFLLARFDPSGSLDPTFGDGGFVTTRVSNDWSWITAIAVLDDGRIVAVGNTLADSGRAVVARYDSSGQLDPGFGNQGIARLPPDLRWRSPGGLALLEDGSIIVGLGEGAGGGEGMALAKLRPDGSLDPGFSNDGFRIEVSSAFIEVKGVALDAAGRVYVGGSASPSQNSLHGRYFVSRYLADGRRDRSYGRRGKTRIQFQKRADPETLLVSRNGQAVLVGTIGETWGPPVGTSLIVRFTSSGARDRTFGNNGVVRIHETRVSGAAIQPDGKLVVAGDDESDDFLLRMLGGDWDGTEQCE